jgi:hypothetical protein
VLTLDGYSGKKPLSLEMVHKRLRKFNEFIEKNPRAKEADGSIWLDTDVDERNKAILEISAQFPAHFSALLAKYGCSYLDNVALAPGGSSKSDIKNMALRENRHAHAISPPQITGIDLHSNDSTLLGTVLKIDNALSPIFVKSYLDGMDMGLFTQDGKYSHHDRGYRFSSKGHMADNTHPAWILFGEGSGSNLLLSQPLNSAEVSLLSVVNFIYHHYSAFVNSHFENSFGSRAVERWGLPTDYFGHYDSLMTMVANPCSGTYGMHDDGKPGLCIADKIGGTRQGCPVTETQAGVGSGQNPEADRIGGSGHEGPDEEANVPNIYSRFNMVVPTVCVQNHTKETTRVEFYEERLSTTNPLGIPAGVVTCSTVTIHVQLAGVQHYCKHVVSLYTFFPFLRSVPVLANRPVLFNCCCSRSLMITTL